MTAVKRKIVWVTVGIGDKVISIVPGHDVSVPGELVKGLGKQETIGVMEKAGWGYVTFEGSLRAVHTLEFCFPPPTPAEVRLSKTKPLKG